MDYVDDSAAMRRAWQDDIGRLIERYCHRARTYFGDTVAFSAAQQLRTCVIPSAEGHVHIVPADSLDLPLADMLTLLYDYGVCAQRPRDLDWTRDCAPAVAFLAESAHAWDASALPDEEAQRGAHLVQRAWARYVLDQNAVLQAASPCPVRFLTIEQVALLAQQPPDGVRAASLVTSASGGADALDPAHALAWLRMQPGFTLTTFRAPQLTRSWSDLSTPAALGLSLRRAREARGLSLRETVRALKLPIDMAAMLRCLEAGELYYEPLLLRQLAALYAMPLRPLIHAALRFHQAMERSRFLRVLNLDQDAAQDVVREASRKSPTSKQFH